MVPTIHLDVAGKRRSQNLARWHNPVEYGSLQTLGVIGSGTGDAFLELRQNVNRKYK
jgi:hypothetical protein